MPPGVALGALGVLAFSITLPATRLAVDDLEAWWVSLGRTAGAGLLAAAILLVTRAPRPTATQARRLLVVALGVVLGFPVLTSLALQDVPAGHGAVVVAVLPASTAVMAVLRAGERPSRSFWLASLAGLAAVLAFVVVGRGTGGGLGLADLELLGAVLLGAGARPAAHAPRRGARGRRR